MLLTLIMLFSITFLAITQTPIVEPLNWPLGELHCTETGDPLGICTWSNWYFVDANGGTHSFPGQTIQRGVFHPDGTITNLRQSTINVGSNDGKYILRATGPGGALFIANSAYPKIQVLSVIYTPPGPNSSVDYKNQTSAGVTTTIDKSFNYALNLSVTSGVDTIGIDYAHTSASTDEETTSKTTSYDILTRNSGNFINHDYDQFDVWLNPQVNVEYSSENIAKWVTAVNPNDHYLPLINGKAQMDHVILLAGWLNGNLPWPANDVLQRLQRSWDTSIPNPGLTTADYAAILALNPFVQQIDPITGNRLPLESNSQIYARVQILNNSRFTLLRNVNYTPVMQTITESIGNVHSSSHSNSNENRFSVSYGYKYAFLGGGAKWTWTHKATVKESNNLTNTATYTIVTPDSTKPLPFASSVDIYQDNIYGTFMFVFPGSGF